jgi:hypothetical protein
MSYRESLFLHTINDMSATKPSQTETRTLFVDPDDSEVFHPCLAGLYRALVAREWYADVEEYVLKTDKDKKKPTRKNGSWVHICQGVAKIINDDPTLFSIERVGGSTREGARR